MTDTTAVQFFLLGELAKAQGRLGARRSKATSAQLRTGTQVVGSSVYYTSKLERRDVVCVEDRLHLRAPRLAGGALALALMRNFLRGGYLLSEDLRELKVHGFKLWLHDDCGAIKLAPTLIPSELSNVNAEGYRLLAALGTNVPMAVRRRIAEWARTITPVYFDVEKAHKYVDGIDPVHGEHNAVFAVVDARDGETYSGGPMLRDQTDGLLAFVFTPWVAVRDAEQMTTSRDDAFVAATLALVFTAQVFLVLGGPDLRIALRR